jgi:DNA-binding transcriptional LysR family regulator
MVDRPGPMGKGPSGRGFVARVNLKQLEAFVAVADLGSFRRAAEKLNTTQPNISARIAALEASLGRVLMERDAGSVRLTPVGDGLLQRARAVLGALDAFLVAAGEPQAFEGVLRLGVTEMIVHSWLGAYLTALKARFPNVDVDLSVDFSANLSAALFGRAIDLALQNGPFARQTSGMAELGRFPLIWVAAPALGLGGAGLALDDLARHPLLTHARGTQPFEQLRAHVGSAGHVKCRLVPSTNITACLQMTEQGLGVACLPEVMVREKLADGALERLDYNWTPDALEFWARFDAEIAPHYVSEAAEVAAEVSRRVEG